MVTVGCDDGPGVPPDRQLPYRFETAAALGPASFFHDLDGDGRDEILEVLHPAAPLPGLRTSVLLQGPRLARLHQLNYVGLVAPPHTLDVDDDGIREIFIPLLRSDTLHLRVADAAGNEVFGFPLAARPPRPDAEGEAPWDPSVLGFHLLDVTGNRRRELVSVISTGSADMAGGVFVYALPGGRLIDSLTVGPGLDQQTLAQLRSGGSVLVLAKQATQPTGASAVTGGFDDRRSYAFAVDLRVPLRVRWVRELGGMGSRVWLRSVDLTGNKDELLVVASRRSGTRLAVLSTLAGVTLRSRESPELDSPVVTDLEGDGEPEIVAIEGGSSLVVFDPELNPEGRVTLPMQVGQLEEWPDLDGDGTRELSVFDTGESRYVLLSGSLQPKAILPGGGGSRALQLDAVRRGPTQTPLLVASAGEGSRGFELVDNRWYAVWRLGPPLAAAAVPLLFLLLAAAWFRARRRYWLHKRAARALKARHASVSEECPPRRPALRVEAGSKVDRRGPPRRSEEVQQDGHTERRRRPA
jgi:hypothetical protein